MKNKLFSFSLAMTVLLGGALSAVLPSVASAEALGPIDFESPTYVVGNINGQDGWLKTGAYDAAVVSSPVISGSQSLRISDSVTSGSFGDQTFSKPLANEAGETTDALNGGLSGGTRQPHFEAQFDLASVLPLVQQPGMHVSVSPDRGDGARMSYLRFEDQADGIHVFFDDTPNPTHVVNSGGFFTETDIATITRTSHTIKFSMDFVDGPDNDVVKIYIDGILRKIGTSWEDYYRYATESQTSPSDVNKTRTVDSLLFRESGAATPGDADNGFLIDNLSLLSGPAAAAPIASTIVVHQGDLDTNGPSPATVAADGLNKWFFYNDETDIVDNTLGSMIAGPGTPPLGTGSAQISVTGTQRRNLATYQFGGTKLGDITTLKFSTYNPSAGNVGSANRSAYLNFNVDFTGNSTVWQRRLAFVPSQNGTVTQDNWKEWDAIQGGNALYSYSGATWPDTLTGPDTGLIGIPGTTLKSWNSLLADYPGIRVLPGDSWLGMRVGEPYADGYTENLDKFVLGTAATVTTFDFDPAPPTGSIAITKYACPDGTVVTRAANGVGGTLPAGCVPDSGKTFGYVHGTQTDANAPFPELSTTLTAGGATDGTGLLTIPSLPTDGRYLVVETDGSNVQLPASAILGLYCQGDGDTSGTNDNQELTFVHADTATNCIAYDKLVVPPPTTGHIIVDKVTDPAADPTIFSFTTTGTEFNGPFTLTDVATPNDQELPPGTYTVTETPTTGWTLSNVSCIYDNQSAGTTVTNGEQVTIAAGDVVRCTFTNTKNPVVNQVQVHIFKYVDGVLAVAGTVGNAAFPMETTFNSPNLGNVTNVPFTLSPTGWGGTDSAYEASFVGSNAGADYEADEILTTPVVGEACDGSHTFSLVGYTTGDTLLAAQTVPGPTAPSFLNLQSDKYVIVWNKTCPTTASLTVYKTTVGGNGTFTLTADHGIGSFPITTVAGTGHSQTFTNLTPGTYNVTETPQSGWTQTENTCTQFVLNAGDNAICTVTNTNNKKLGVIRGIKYEDRDGDGKLSDGDHHRLAGWTIYLDLNNNTVLDAGEPSTVTDSHGVYQFVGLVAGTYHVREVGQAGWVQTYPSGGVWNITLAAGQIAKQKSFGNFKKGSISGMKYNDLNGNGHKDAGDVGLPGWTINIKGPHGFTASAITDVNGNYSFIDLLGGNYTLTEVQQATWHQTDHPGTVKIQSGTNSTKDDFGNTQKVIGNHGHDDDKGHTGDNDDKNGNHHS